MANDLMPPREAEVIFFDLVGTLIRSKGTIGEHYAEWARRFGAGGADPLRLGRAFRDAMSEAEPMAFPDLGTADAPVAERRWWRELVRKVVRTAGLADLAESARFDEFFLALYDHFTTADAWETFPDVFPALTALRARGMSIGLITNYDTRVHPVLDAVGLTGWLDSVTIPALVGAAKPDPRIFAHALGVAGVAASGAVYVGDDPGDDYAGAAAAGIFPILLDRDGRYEGRGFRRLRSLAGLVEGD